MRSSPKAPTGRFVSYISAVVPQISPVARKMRSAYPARFRRAKRFGSHFCPIGHALHSFAPPTGFIEYRPAGHMLHIAAPAVGAYVPFVHSSAVATIWVVTRRVARGATSSQHFAFSATVSSRRFRSKRILGGNGRLGMRAH